MSIDVVGIRDDVFAYVTTAALPLLNMRTQDILFWIAVTCFVTSLIALLYISVRDWKQQRGYRMAVRERTDKETELLCQIINDGLFEAELKGKLSERRMNALYQLCSDKLELPDLIPKERRLKLVKEQVKSRLVKSGKLNPATWRKTTFSTHVGKFKFW